VGIENMHNCFYSKINLVKIVTINTQVESVFLFYGLIFYYSV